MYFALIFYDKKHISSSSLATLMYIETSSLTRGYVDKVMTIETERVTLVIFGNLNGGPKTVSGIDDNGEGGALTP